MAKPRAHKDNDDEEMKDLIQKRFKHMFSKEAQPLSNMSIQEVEALKARVAELETELAQKQTLKDEGRSTPVSETVTQLGESRAVTQEAPEGEEKQKQIALWISGTLIAVTVSFFGFAMYALLVLQGGKPDYSDWYLIPFTVLMVALTLIGHLLIRRDRPALGGWILYLIDAILLPVSMVLFLDGIFALASGYLAIFVLLFIIFVIPRESKRNAIFAALGAGLAIVAIEIWHPGFRVGNNHLGSLIPFLVGLTLLIILIYLFRQAFAGNIRVKLITSFLAIALLSTGIVAVSTQRSLSASLTENIGTNLSKLANAKALEIGVMLDRDQENLEALTLNKVLHDQLEAANTLDATDPAEINRLDQEWRNATKDNDPLIWAVLHSNVADQLRKFQKQFPQYVEVFVTDKYGENTASTNRTSDFYQADEEWWQTAWNHGKGGLFISQPVFDESAGIYAIDIALPIRADDNSGIIGILRGTVDVTAFKEALLAGQFGRSGRVDLVFPDGQYLNDESGKTLLTLNPESSAQLANFDEPHGQFAYQGIFSVISKKLVSATGASQKEELEALGWYVIVHQDQSEALQPIATTTRTTVFISFLVIILAGALAFYVGRLLTTPLTQLTSAAMQVSQGDLNVQARVNSRDEIGRLAVTFNNMTQQLRDLLNSLEYRVSERTRELELASEVGRTVSQKLANLDELLSEATELIRDRFNLYYTQIYLIDSSQRLLVLRAGTGTVGTELMRRNHRLMVSSGSINGRAVSDEQTVIVTDTTQSPNFLPNPLLPNTRSEMAVPLIAAGHVVGVLDMQSEQPEALNESNLPAFEALAGQLAIAIQNASLFADAEQARSEMELQARRLTSSGWQEFLNGIERGEQLSYAFDQEKIVSVEADSSVRAERALTVPISIIDTEIGAIELEKEADHNWTEHESQIAHAAADLLGRHVENLRLLAQAEQYRFEAEQVSRRLTREGWESFLENRNQVDAYVYDLNEVRPLAEQGTSENTLKQTLAVRDEAIGELAVDADSNSPEVMEILEAVAQQLSGHIENLRLSELNQRHAQREQTLRQITSALRSSTNPETIMRTAVRELGSILGRRTVVQLASPKQDPQTVSTAANGNGSHPAVDPHKSA